MSSDVIGHFRDKFSVTSAEARFNKSHIRKVYACFSCNLPPALFGRMTGIFYVLLR